jgi:hypothetical protein
MEAGGQVSTIEESQVSLMLGPIRIETGTGLPVSTTAKSAILFATQDRCQT